MAQRDLKDGLTSRTGLGMPPKTGGYTYVEFFTDNSLSYGDQVKAFAPVTLRVAIQMSNGHWQTVNPYVVGRATKDTSQPRFRIKVTDKNSVYVSVIRLSGDGTEPIQVCAY